MILFLVIVAAFAILNSRIQSRIVNQLTKTHGSRLGTVVNIESTKINFLNRLQFKNIYIEDLHGDTLLFSHKLTVNYKLKLFNRTKGTVHLKEANLDNAFINFYSLNDTVNVDFIIRYIKNMKDTTKTASVIKIDELYLTNAHFVYNDKQSTRKPDGLDLSHLSFRQLNIQIEDFLKKSDTLDFYFKDLSFIDQSGLKLTHLESDFSLHQTFLHFTKPTIEFNRSQLICDELKLSFTDFKSIGSGNFAKAAYLDIPIKESEIYFSDLAYFTPSLKGVDNKVYITTHLTGYLENVKLNNTRILFGNNTYLRGDFDFNGLPDIQNTFMFFDFKTLETSLSDISSIQKDGSAILRFPAHLEASDIFKYHGNFTGFLTDFVAYGTFNSEFGTISTDVSLRPDSLKNVAYKGTIKSRDLALGSLLNDTNYIGRSAFNLNIHGTKFKNDGVLLYTQGQFDYLEFNKYPIQNILLNGLLSNKKYNGVLLIDDENLDLAFNGLVDFADTINQYKFEAKVKNANLYKLGIVNDDPEFNVRFNLKANAKGNNINNANGSIYLSDAYFKKSDNELEIEEGYLETFNSSNSNYLILNSDLVDVSISGKYQIEEIKNTFQAFFDKYLTALTNESVGIYNHTNFKSVFRLNADFKKIQRFTQFFFPELHISDSTIIEAHFSPKSQLFDFVLRSNKIKYKNIDWSNMYINSTSNDSIFTIESGSEYLHLNNQVSLDNFTLLSEIKKDTIGVNMRWNNWDTIVNKGDIKLEIHIGRDALDHNLKYTLQTAPSTFIIRDSTWNINELNAQFHEAVLTINNFKLYHDNQSVKIHGKVSGDINDSIRVDFENYNLANVNLITREKNLEFKGKLHGHAFISKSAQQLKLLSDITVEKLILNNRVIGNIGINSIWNDKDKSVNLVTNIYNGNLNSLSLIGKYYPFDNDRLSFNLLLDRYNMSTLNPYIDNVFNDLRGLVSGNLTIKGNAKSPDINGELDLRKCSFEIDYLKTRYNFSDAIECQNNRFLFNQLVLFDQYGNQAALSGSINLPKLNQLELNLIANINNFLCLNTTLEDNSSYYGTAYATGAVKISGNKQYLNFDIAASTNRNTKFYIPLTNESSNNEYNFINFKSPDTKNKEESIFINHSATVDLTRTNLNFDLQITPDAEVQLIFDSKIGDIIKARGAGDINLDINNLGKLTMYGDYIISEGDYLFTLKNVINKRFSIKPGGEITWNGKPNEADMNIEAIYSTKTSIPSSFLSYGSSEESSFNQKIQTNCILSLSGQLKTPEIKTGIEFPRVNENLRTQLEGRLSNQEEINKQFLWLLVVNSFMVEEQNANYNAGAVTRASGVNATTELLSNQLSNWLSQISNQVDINFSYQKGELANPDADEIGLAFSTQVLNDRVNISVGGNYTSQYKSAQEQNAIVGDFDMDVKLSKSGKLRFKAFNHYTNENFNLYENTYKQGIGMFYQEDFNSLNELFSRYWNRIFNNKEVDKKD